MDPMSVWFTNVLIHPDTNHPVFEKVPTVLTAEEIIDKAFRRARSVSAPQLKKTIVRIRAHNLARVFTVRDVVVGVLNRYINGFPRAEALHPFYRALLDLLLDINQYKKSLGALNWARSMVERLTERYHRRIKGAPDKETVDALRREFYGRVASVLKQVADDLMFLASVREEFRKIPHIDPSLPTIIVAGFPNVGKSEFVRRISTAHPEVAPYPFTTKGITVGHFERNGRRWQVVDTPGLLDRELEDRNAIEMQAVLALSYLKGVILFILDPSETCGYPMERQRRLLDQVRREFKGLPLLVVENKCDVVRTDTPNLKMSALTGEGIEEVLSTVEWMAGGV